MIRAAALILMAAPAAASEAFIPPVGCEGVVTVQSRGCEVDNIYTCSADAPGDSWRVSVDLEGPKFIGRIDAETQWMESIDLFPTRREVIEQPAADPASLSELLATGTDAFDFNMRSDGGAVTRVVGFDQLTGEEVVSATDRSCARSFTAATKTRSPASAGSRATNTSRPSWAGFFLEPTALPLPTGR